MTGLHKKGIAIDIIVIGAISVVILVVLITLFVSNAEEQQKKIGEVTNTLDFCKCIYTKIGEEAFCSQPDCEGLAPAMGIDCSSYDMVIGADLDYYSVCGG